MQQGMTGDRRTADFGPIAPQIQDEILNRLGFDAPVPVQMARLRDEVGGPERALYAALLHQAVLEAAMPHDNATRREARDWIAGRVKRPRVSFEWACSVVGVDADAARLRILGPDALVIERAPGRTYRQQSR